ncbi:hypothetical protein D3C77_517280 [compost metagenome]
MTYIYKVFIGWILSYTPLDPINKQWSALIINIIISSLTAYLIGWSKLEYVLISSLITSFLWFASDKNKNNSMHNFLRRMVVRWVIAVISFFVFLMVLVNISFFHDVLFIKPLIPALILLIVIVRRRKK